MHDPGVASGFAGSAWYSAAWLPPVVRENSFAAGAIAYSSAHIFYVLAWSKAKWPSCRNKSLEMPPTYTSMTTNQRRHIAALRATILWRLSEPDSNTLENRSTMHEAQRFGASGYHWIQSETRLICSGMPNNGAELGSMTVPSLQLNPE
jgi:hypothetical protein